MALVTGGSGGIGAACCRALAGEGFQVAIHYRQREDEAKRILAGIADGFLLRADLEDIFQIDALVEEIRERKTPVLVLVNNAGRAINAEISGMKIDQFDAQRALLRGVWYLTKRIIRQFMLREGRGRIINISSVVGRVGNAGQIPYSMEKAALDAFTKSLAREMKGRNILVNSVSPGFIATDMTEHLPEEAKRRLLDNVVLGRPGTPEEVAEVVAFLAVKGTYLTGSVITVDGGLYGG